MKKYQLINYHHLLSQIDLQKVDKEARATLISLDITLGDIVDSHNEELEKVKARLSKGHEEAIRRVSALFEEMNAADDARKAEIKAQLDNEKEYSSIAQALNDEVNKRLLEDVTIEVEVIPSTDLAQWCAESNIRITLDLLREFRRAGFTN